jgi:AAA domain/Transcriptional regulator, AbiEi antitoxin
MTIDVDAELARIKEKKRRKAAADEGHPNGSAEGKPGSSWRERVSDAAALQHMEFPPLKYILPVFIPEGATLLVSRPKLGKSWLVLDIAIATAAGRFTLGDLKPSTGAVLYLALEDGKRRLQRRITRLLPTFSDKWPDRLKIATEWPRADQGGLDDIEAWVVAMPDARLVIVDTLAQFRKVPNGKTPPYLDDYAAISGMQKLASKYNIGIVIVHHDRKADADDVFDTVSGTLGLTGAADTILIMKRQAGAVGLYVRGRDIEEVEKAVQFNKATCRWTILGEAAEVFRSVERNRVIAALEESGEALSVTEIMAAAGIKSRGAADMLLSRMVRDGVLRKVSRGKYELEALDRGKHTQPPEAQDEFGVSNDLTHLTQGSADSAAAPDEALRPARVPNASRPPDPLCDHCGQLLRPGDNGQAWNWSGRPDGIWLHARCEAPWLDSEGRTHVSPSSRTPEAAHDPWRDLGIPDSLRRPAPVRCGAPASSAGSDADLK